MTDYFVLFLYMLIAISIAAKIVRPRKPDRFWTKDRW